MFLGNAIESLDLVTVFYAPDELVIEPRRVKESEIIVELITKGRVWSDFGDGERKVYGPGSVFCHLAGEITVNEPYPGDPYECVPIFFTTSNIEQFRPTRFMQWKDLESFMSFAQEIPKAFHDPDCDRKQLLEYIEGVLNWQFYKWSKAPQEIWPKKITAAVKYLENNPELNVAVTDLAKRYGFSKQYFQSLFKRHTGKSPHQYQLSVRLQKARQSLSQSTDSIKEIASSCGFDNIESFYRAFRKHSGTTPGEYRKQHQFYD